MSKWWGWGNPDLTFPMKDKPLLWPWIRQKLGMTTDVMNLPVARADVAVPASNVHATFMHALKDLLKPEQISFDETERLNHSFGKSYPNLWHARSGFVPQAPDVVVWPSKHDDVVAILNLANEHDICVVPFGGGTNIVGGVDPRDDKERMTVSLDMRRMNRLLSLDPHSMTATIEAGALGPKLELDLEAKGFNLGHYPDSFEYSTLGGWLATRSAGMQSDEYGKIEDMLVSLKMVTPAGTIVTRTVPASSAGPDLNRIVCGSEGVLGVITEATMRVHRMPEIKDYRGFLFPNFESGVAAAHECVHRGFSPSMIRLQDAGETQLALHMKSPKKGLKGLIEKPIKAYLKANGYTAPCVLVVGFEGYKDAIKSTRDAALKIIRKHKGFSLGASVGKTWSKDKFNIPYLRDYVMDFSVMCDVAETATTWHNLVPLHTATVKALTEKFAAEWGHGYVGCHVSHTYKTGACLYFTYASRQVVGKELEQYYAYKKLVTDCFMENGATLTHHHAVGYEHRPWMEQEIGATGVEALRALKERLDPRGILNPGKLIPDAPTPPVSKKLIDDELLAVTRRAPAALRVEVSAGP